MGRGETGMGDHWDRVLMECPRAHGYLTIGTGIVGIGRGARMVMIDKGFGRRLVGLTVLRVPRSWLTPPLFSDALRPQINTSPIDVTFN